MLITTPGNSAIRRIIAINFSNPILPSQDAPEYRCFGPDAVSPDAGVFSRCRDSGRYIPRICFFLAWNSSSVMMPCCFS